MNMNENFFSTLKALSRKLEKSIKETQHAVENDTSQEYCHADASKLLKYMRKDIKDITSQCRSVTKSLQESGSKFDEYLQTSELLVKCMNQNLTEAEEYMHQYGYKVWKKPECINSSEEIDDSDDEEENVNKNDAQLEVDESVPDNSSTKNELKKTPKLEDFGGISDFTMRMLSKMGSTQKRVAVSTARVASTVNSTQSILAQTAVESRSHGDSVPAVFQHDGLTVTPSLLNGRHIPMMTPDTDRVGSGFALTRAGMQGSITDSPVPPLFKTPGMKPITKMSVDQTAIKQPDFGDQSAFDSPIPPLFQTPGIKQIPTKQVITLTEQTQTLPSQQMGSCYAVYNDSPQPPVFQTPGMKQIQKDGHEADEKIGSCYSAYNDSPIRPTFLTPGLKPMADASIVEESNDRILKELNNKQPVKTSLFGESEPLNMKQQQRPKLQPWQEHLKKSYAKRKYEEKPASPNLDVTSKLDEMMELTKSFQTAYSMASFKKEPRAPELLADRLGKRDVETPPSPDLLADRLRKDLTTSITPQPKLLSEQLQKTKTFTGFETTGGSPPPPRFLGKYNFNS